MGIVWRACPKFRLTKMGEYKSCQSYKWAPIDFSQGFFKLWSKPQILVSLFRCRLGLKSLDTFFWAAQFWAMILPDRSLGSPLKYLSQNYHMLLPHDIESMIRIIPLINLLQIYFLWCCGQLKMLGRFLHEVGAYNKLYENVKYLDHFVLEEGLNSSFLSVSIADENHKYTEQGREVQNHWLTNNE